MAFTGKISAYNTNNCKDLVVVDAATYGAALNSVPKSLFVGRTIKLTRYDGIQQTIPFPYTGTPDAFQDTFTVADYFPEQDYIVSIELTYVYNIGMGNVSISTTLDFVSECYANECYINKALECDCGCGNGNLEFLATLESYLKGAETYVKFGELLKGQEFLDCANKICSPIANCGCK